MTARKKELDEQDMPSFLHYELVGVVLLTAGLFSFIALLGFEVGSIGSLLRKIALYLLGRASIAVPLMFILIGARYVWRRV